MALLQVIQTTHGVPALYWKVSSAAFNLDGSITLRVDGYLDETARRNEYESLKSFSYTVSAVDTAKVFPSQFNVVDAYAYVKLQTEFAFGSVDVL